MPDEREESYQDQLVPKLTFRAKRLCRLVASGYSLKDAAELTAFSISRACIITKSSVGQEYIAQIEGGLNEEVITQTAAKDSAPLDRARRRIEQELEDSVERIIALRDNSDNGNVALRASQDILDRGGVEKKQKVEVEGKVLGDPGLLEALSRLKDLQLPKPLTPQVSA